MNKLKVVFCGTPDFSIPTLEALYHHPKVDLIKVVSMPSRKKGRGMKLADPPVIEYAKENKIPFIQPESINKVDESEFQDADLFIVLAFAQFLSEKTLSLAKQGCFNIHTSLLPKYRGAAPIQYAVLNNDKETGVSIQKMVKEMDAGDVYYLKKCVIDEDETSASLYTKLKFLAGISTFEFINQFIEGSLSATPQDPAGISFAPSIKKNEGAINFKEMTFQEILSRKKAFTPWPGCFFGMNGKRVKVLGFSQAKETLGPGEISFKTGEFLIGCKDFTLHLDQFQLEGKKATTDRDFINGNKDKLDQFEITEIS
ncbi:MAG: methionyl-tRNA formyltransferase [Bacteriovoracaceae bacterium]